MSPTCATFSKRYTEHINPFLWRLELPLGSCRQWHALVDSGSSLNNGVLVHAATAMASRTTGTAHGDVTAAYISTTNQGILFHDSLENVNNMCRQGCRIHEGFDHGMASSASTAAPNFHQ
jgi:hypothetical protein